MRKSFGMQSNNLSIKAALQQLGPPLLATLFVLFLSGGFPPANWQLLAQVLLHFSAYKAVPGMSTQTVLVVLWVQAVLLALVWIGLIVLILRAVFALLNGQARVPATRSQAVRMRTAPVALGNVTLSTTGTASDHLKKPFEDLARHGPRRGTITLGKASAPKSSQSPGEQQKKLSAPPSANPKRTTVPEPTKQTGKPADPFNVQPDILDLFAQSDPLDANSSSAQHIRNQGQPAKAAQAEFVFGNPFEGPLPEVFEYDTDLKQSLADLKPGKPAPGTSTQYKKGVS